MLRHGVLIMAFVLGIAMLGGGIFALIQAQGGTAPDLPRSEAYGLRDQGVVALMGGGLAVLGLLRAVTRRPKT